MAGDGIPHTLVVYGSSSRADSVLRELVSAAREDGRRVSVVSLSADPRRPEMGGGLARVR